MKKMKKIAAMTLSLLMAAAGFTACGSADASSAVGTAEYTIGICNYVDDASLNQIVENIQNRLTAIGEEKDVSFKVDYDNCNADANLMSQIIANFTADKADLMVGVATPVAMAMQAATEDSGVPVVFAAVSDPVSTGLVDSLEAPGSNITGTSDYLDTTAVMNLIFAANPDAKKIGLLYDVGQDSSATPHRQGQGVSGRAQHRICGAHRHHGGRGGSGRPGHGGRRRGRGLYPHGQHHHEGRAHHL